MLTMGTSTLKWAFFALLIQVTVGLPSFGTSDQLEQWNEVDDEHPGEKLPDDYMMPMRDPNGSTDDKTTDESKSTVSEHSPASPSLNTENNVVKPVPEKVLPTETHQSKVAPVSGGDITVTNEKAPDSLLNLQEKEPSMKSSGKLTVTSNQPITDDNIPNPVPEKMITTETHQSKVVPVNGGDITVTTEKDPDSLLKPQEKEPTMEASGKLTVTSNQPKTDDNIPKPVPERLTTVRPQTRTAHLRQDTTDLRQVGDSLPKAQQNQDNPILVVRMRSLPSHDELPDPIPTPKPPTEGEEEDCECVECEEEIEKQKSGGEVGQEVDCQEADVLPVHVETNRDNKVAEQSPLSLLQTGKEGESLEDIFNDVVKVMSRMTLSDKENIIKSLPFSKSEEEKMGLHNEKEMPNVIAGIMMKITKVRSDDEDDAPCNKDDSDNQEQSLETQLPFIKPSSLIRENKLPIKGILLKSLIPRHTTPEDLFEILKNRHNGMDRKMITSLNEVIKNRVNKPARFVALQNEGYTSRLPPLRFPEEQVHSISRDPELSEIPLIIKSRPSDNEFVRHFINSLRPSELSPKLSSPFSSFGEYNEHVQRLDPEMKGLMNIVLKQMAAHEGSNVIPEPASIVKNLEDVRFSS